MRVHYLQHVSFETPGLILEWAEQRGHELGKTLLFESAQFPRVEDLDLLLIMGGPMSVHDIDLYEWLAKEKEFIKRCLAANKKILGICLGSQLLSEACGGEVTKNPEKEIGFFPVRFTAEARSHFLFRAFSPIIHFFHWHGEQFSIPPGAIRLAETDACPNQGFLLLNNRAMGIQFHPEATAGLVNRMLQEGLDELIPSNYVQAEEDIKSSISQGILNSRLFLFELLDRFVGRTDT
jgi:GMP synthase-like glutamine amidotransferase